MNIAIIKAVLIGGSFSILLCLRESVIPSFGYNSCSNIDKVVGISKISLKVV